MTSDRSHGVVLDAAAYAATEMGLPRSWLSESVAMYAWRNDSDDDRISLGLYPSPEKFGLRVTAAKPSYILAMKLKALERATIDDRDYEDAVNLGVAYRQWMVFGRRYDNFSRTRSFLQKRRCDSKRSPRTFALNWDRLAMLRPQTLADVARRAREAPSDIYIALNEFADEFYLDHPVKAAQQERIDPIPDPVGEPLADALLGAVGEHLAQRWGLKIPAWTWRPIHSALEKPHFMPDSKAIRGVLIVESPPAFRSRLIFTGVKPLDRARFPKEAAHARVPLDWPPPADEDFVPVAASPA